MKILQYLFINTRYLILFTYMAGITQCCDLPTRTNSPAQTCGYDFSQTLRMGFQKKQATASFATQAALIDLAVWQPLLNEPDLDKRIFMTNVVFDNRTGLFGFTIGEAPTLTVGGGDDSTTGGNEIIIGSKDSPVSAMLHSLHPSVITWFRSFLNCPNQLTVYLFGADGSIVANTQNARYGGFDFVGTFLGSKQSQNKSQAERDMNPMTGLFPFGWDETMYKTPATTFALTMTNA